MQSKLHRTSPPRPLPGARGSFRCVPWSRRVTTSRLIGRSVDWLVRGRERDQNFTYDLDSLNTDQLCWFVSAVTGAQIAQVRGWMRELEDDTTRRPADEPVVVQSASGRFVRVSLTGRDGWDGIQLSVRYSQITRRDRHPPWSRVLCHRRCTASKRARPTHDD